MWRRKPKLRIVVGSSYQVKSANKTSVASKIGAACATVLKASFNAARKCLPSEPIEHQDRK